MSRFLIVFQFFNFNRFDNFIQSSFHIFTFTV